MLKVRVLRFRYDDVIIMLCYVEMRLILELILRPRCSKELSCDLIGPSQSL